MTFEVRSGNETGGWYKKWSEQIILYAPLFIWIGVILFLGSGQGSSTRTSIIIRPILEFLFPNASADTISFYHGIVRKLAHFTEYGVLACLALRASLKSLFDLIRRHPYFAALLLVFCIAATDEYLQSFDSSRTSSPYDVLIDVVGGIVALLVAAAVRWRWASRKKNPAANSAN